METEKIKDVVLQHDELLNGVEAFAIVEGLKLFNEKHKEYTRSMEAKGKRMLIGENYFETIINHGLLWKLKKLSNNDAVENSSELKNGKI
tara:strand:+ start:1011 stop:1280 length:270 start_codon:yes stop_codon:yes gene_type:complete